MSQRTRIATSTIALVALAVTLALVLISSPARPLAAQGKSTKTNKGWQERSFEARSTEAFFIDHNGQQPLGLVPAGIDPLSDPGLETLFGVGTRLRELGGGPVIGIATELEQVLPTTDLEAGTLDNLTLWTLVIPGEGTITIDEVEEQSRVVKEVFLPALQSGEAWEGNLRFRTTVGPISHGTNRGKGRIVGGTGDFAGIRGTAIESVEVRRFDPTNGEFDATSELMLRYKLRK